MSHELRTARGRITVTGPALAGVVVRAAEDAGVRVRRPRRGLAVDVAGGRVRVALELTAAYGSVLPELGRDVQRRVSEALARTTGLRVAAVDVAFEELDR